MHLYTAIRFMYLYHACQKTKEATSLLPPSIMHEYASSEFSASQRDLTLLVADIVTIPASPTMDQNISDAALSSPDASFYKVAGDQEQLEYPYRPRTPGEEEIMRIYKDGVYKPLDIIELPVGFQTQRFCVRLGRTVMESAAESDDPEFRDAAHCRAALHRPDIESVAELDDLDFRDAAHCRAAFHRPNVESAAKPDEPDSGDAAPYRAALHRPVVQAAEAGDDLDSGDATPL